jgi:hypothetical protein
MRSGKEIWDEASKHGADARSAHNVRIFALVEMMAHVQAAVLRGDDVAAVERLREVQAHAEIMVGMLIPQKRRTPTLVVT